MSREKARQKFIRLCMGRTNMRGAEADSFFNDFLLPIIFEIIEIKKEIPSTLEKPHDKIDRLLKLWGWNE